MAGIYQIEELSSRYIRGERIVNVFFDMDISKHAAQVVGVRLGVLVCEYPLVFVLLC